MIDQIEFNIVPSELDGLLVIATKREKKYKLYITAGLLAENGLQIWQFDDPNYYEDFLDENISKFILGIDHGYYQPYSDGFNIDRIN